LFVFFVCLFSKRSPSSQRGYYVAGGGSKDWTGLMRTQLDEMHGNVTNLLTYIAPGDAHCRNNGHAYWLVVSGGTGPAVFLYDWVNQLLTGNASIAPAVDCMPNCA
jgi:hypothetical protein